MRPMRMGSYLFICPTTQMAVHGWAADEVPPIDYYEAVECTACKHVHLVNPRTGKVAGERNG